MLYFYVKKDGEVWGAVEASDREPGCEREFVYRGDFESMADAEKIAESATRNLGEKFIATDGGRGLYPRFDVIRAPAIGDKVSMKFNGDSYPCGEIVKISPTMKRITTSNGTAFYRSGESSAWVYNGCWGMIRGHHNDRNESF